MRAIGAIGESVRREAFLLAYSDCFLALGCVLLDSAIALCFMKRLTLQARLEGIDVQQRAFSPQPISNRKLTRQCMKAMQVNNAKQGAALIIAKMAQPIPGEGELLIRVQAAGVTPTELFWYPTTHTKDGAEFDTTQSPLWAFHQHNLLGVDIRSSLLDGALLSAYSCTDVFSATELFRPSERNPWARVFALCLYIDMVSSE